MFKSKWRVTTNASRVALLICAGSLIFAISAADALAQRYQLMKRPYHDVVKLTSVEVMLQTGPDKTEWSRARKDNAPTTLSFRWSTGYPNVGSAVWQISTDPFGKNVIASGDAGKPPAKGRVRGFTIDFGPIVGGSEQRPLNYYVRVITYKRLGVRPSRPQPVTRPLMQPLYKGRRPAFKPSLVSAGDNTRNRAVLRGALGPKPPFGPSLVSAGDNTRNDAVLKEQAGPPSPPVHVSIIAPGPGTHFTEIGLRPELLDCMPIEIDLHTLKIRGSGGDEDPYLFVVVVYADGTTVIPQLSAGKLVFPTSTVRIDSPTKTHENVPVDVDPGANLAIPRSTGHFARTIRPIGVEKLANSYGQTLSEADKQRVRENTFVGILVIGMEEDAIPSTKVVNAARDMLVHELRSAFTKIIREVQRT